MRYDKLHTIEGTVQELLPWGFTAKMDIDDELHSFSLIELSPADKKLVAPGAVFWQDMGKLTFDDGRVVMTTHIRFSRAVWTEQEIKEVEEAAKQYEEFFT